MSFDTDTVIENYLDDYGDNYETIGGTDIKTFDDFKALDPADSILIGIFLSLLVFAIAVSVVRIIAIWKIFKKAGKNGWEAIVPVYNGWVLYEISGLPGWLVFVAFIPYLGILANLVFSIISYINISRAFKKDDAYAIGLIFLPTIFFSILGFGKSEYTNTDKAIKIFN